jgi:hypothetical protein
LPGKSHDQARGAGAGAAHPPAAGAFFFTLGKSVVLAWQLRYERYAMPKPKSTPEQLLKKIQQHPVHCQVDEDNA